MKILLILLGIFYMSQGCLSAQVPKMNVQQFPESEMKKQNTKLALLVAQELNKTLPKKIDKYTTLINIVAENASLIYNFEINSSVKSDESIRKEDHARMQRAVTRGVCQTSHRFLTAGINITYIYLSAKTKEPLFRFDITQDTCQKNLN